MKHWLTIIIEVVLIYLYGTRTSIGKVETFLRGPTKSHNTHTHTHT